MAFAPSEHDIASRLAPSAAERSASRRGRGRQGCSLLPSSRCIYLRGLRLLSPFWRRSAMQAGRYLGSEEGILGSCSVVRKIMSVPCGAVSGDRSQMQSLLYGRLSFSAENSLPPSQTSSKTFSRYCGSLRLKRGEKGGKKGFSSLLPLSSSRRISLGCAGGHAMPLCTRGPSHPRPAENPSPNTGTVVQATRRSQDGLGFHARQGHEAHPSAGRCRQARGAALAGARLGERRGRAPSRPPAAVSCE
ncbi:PREDICTED: uncharacterized protein LOC108449165 isoform X2 [Corvus brachyrhynchos]|uniref:uncharacterized protein LOC108449165 isoform X2 n=1 Tax=Corvus brachyrhynchos TaxID=85066 RepID=UPI000816783A|nr:PREDICTED: uncharacterized protein LOC108449165 isoform X2 [Corvus brachyrhynchos]